MEEAMAIIREAERGYRVYFEILEGGVLVTDYFPDRDEGVLFKSEAVAWDMAAKFAKAVDPAKYVNIYVVDETFSPTEKSKNTVFNIHN